MTNPLLERTDSADGLTGRDAIAADRWQIYADGVRFLALRSLRDSSLADDVAHETILRAMQAVKDENREPITDLVSFIHGIARHVIADFQRHAQRTVPLPSAELMSGEAHALDLLISKDERVQVRRALRQLSHEDRELLSLCYVRGLTASEIAGRTGEPADRIRKRKSRVMERLRAVFFGR